LSQDCERFEASDQPTQQNLVRVWELVVVRACIFGSGHALYLLCCPHAGGMHEQVVSVLRVVSVPWERDFSSLRFRFY